jgi:uncharacterized protein (TIGR00255 family)
MSVRSMTGYGHGVARAGGLRVDVEISSVNRKQLDISINLPKALGQLESRVHEEVAHALHRGRVSVDVTVRGSPELRRKAVRVDQRLAGAYLAELRRVARALKLTDDLGAALLLQLPGVLHFETLEDDVERIGPLLEQAVRGALAALGRMREREGGALARDLRKRLAVMARLAAELRKLAPLAVARYRAALCERVAAVKASAGIPDERLEREIIMFADKSDVTEELTRLASHFDQARGLLSRREPAGKALDFLAQEMYREINTTGSKANDAAMAGRVVLFKTELDRFREQVQNIE